jgi:hypothetical protein
MGITFGDSVKLGNVKENWLFKFYYDLETDFLGMSFNDTVYSGDFYHGIVTNIPSIRTKIDLANSKSSMGNVSISLVNKSHNGGKFSELLIGGTNNYINRKVEIYSVINSDTPVQIYTGRLTSVSHNDDKISLSLVEQRPFDFLTIPNVKSDTDVYTSIVYGDFTKNTCETTSSFLTSKSLFPCPNINIASNLQMRFSYPKAYASDANPHFYDSSIDSFIPFTSGADLTIIKAGVDSAYVPYDMERGYFLIRPFEASGWTNSENAIDTSVTSYASGQTDTGIADPDETLTSEDILSIDVPTVDGELTEWYIYVKGSITHNDISGNTESRLKVNDATMIMRSSDGTTYTSGHTINGNSGYSRIDISAESTINVNLFTSASGIEPSTYGEATATGKIEDIVLRMKVKNDISNEPTASSDKISNLKEVYSGADGLTRSWTTGSVTKIHEAHRDILYRYVGYEDTPDGWSDINTSRSDWDVRWWALEPIEVQKVLEQLQKEGCFIFLWNPDGTGRYLAVKSSYSSSDVSHTLTSRDIDKVSIKNTSFSELLTKMTISYGKHPAESKYLESYDFENSTSRTKWLIRTKENIKEVNLDALTSTTTSPNDDVIEGYYDYYDNIYGDIKIIVSFDVVNPAMYDLIVGDIIQIDDDTAPFGYDWEDKYLMITSVQRSVGKLKIEAREVYSV